MKSTIFKGLKARLKAKKLEHEENNPGHSVAYSVEMEAHICDSCDFMYYNKYSEKETNKLVAAEYENCYHDKYYNTEIEAIKEANFHH